MDTLNFDPFLARCYDTCCSKGLWLVDTFPSVSVQVAPKHCIVCAEFKRETEVKVTIITLSEASVFLCIRSFMHDNCTTCFDAGKTQVNWFQQRHTRYKTVNGGGWSWHHLSGLSAQRLKHYRLVFNPAGSLNSAVHVPQESPERTSTIIFAKQQEEGNQETLKHLPYPAYLCSLRKNG